MSEERAEVATIVLAHPTRVTSVGRCTSGVGTRWRLRFGDASIDAGRAAREFRPAHLEDRELFDLLGGALLRFALAEADPHRAGGRQVRLTDERR
ncbi:MAG: hypothetical protein JO147_10925 [Actinobacteria bacterium]|nr:hypothetical protein [Actinomycetota bacterium]